MGDAPESVSAKSFTVEGVRRAAESISSNADRTILYRRRVSRDEPSEPRRYVVSSNSTVAVMGTRFPSPSCQSMG